MVSERASHAFKRGYWDYENGKEKQSVSVGTFYGYDYEEGWKAAHNEIYWAQRRRDEKRRIQMELSKELQSALYQASNDAAPDMGEGGDDAEAVAEACLSLLDFHPQGKTLREEASGLIKVHGYKAFIAEAAKHVGTV